MRKQKTILFTIILLLCFIVVSIILNQNVNIEKETKIIKEMSSTTYEIELNNQINALNTEHTEYANYIQECKAKIATALTNEGVETSNKETLEKMAENISKVLQARTADATATADNITERKTAYVNGELITSNGTDNDYYNSRVMNINEDSEFVVWLHTDRYKYLIYIK